MRIKPIVSATVAPEIKAKITERAELAEIPLSRVIEIALARWLATEELDAFLREHVPRT